MSDVEHLSVCLLGLWMSSLKKCLFSALAQFLTGLFVFLILSCMSCLYILEVNRLSNTSFPNVNIFAHSEGCLFILFMVSLALQYLLIILKSV